MLSYEPIVNRFALVNNTTVIIDVVNGNFFTHVRYFTLCSITQCDRIIQTIQT